MFVDTDLLHSGGNQSHRAGVTPGMGPINWRAGP